ncbi:hypothetical protein Bca52824_077659 [Brassica carinata]|uniref:MATH domain-containing protein n=1 Tax=Brassica carinata TaxID=52824 RepID=A0A8X7PVD6_BRACI|nr:hypothetical protein Bca52824_077659 [Brassica carinata]
MVDEADKKFTWVIKDFSSLQSQRIYSDRFLIGGYKWYLIAYPKGSKVDCLSLYLGVADHESLPLGWRRNTKFSLKVVNQFSDKSSILREATEWFSHKAPSFGFTKLLPLAKLHAKDGGFLVDEELKIFAEVNVLQVIGESDDESEGSQEAVQPMKKTKCMTMVRDLVAYVRCIFEKHPDFASKVRSNNQHLKSTYINVLLGLIETLCQLPEKLSDDDLNEASAAVSYLTQVGFKVDWLEEKLEEVKEKKTKVNTARLSCNTWRKSLRYSTRNAWNLKILWRSRMQM